MLTVALRCTCDVVCRCVSNCRLHHTGVRNGVLFRCVPVSYVVICDVSGGLCQCAVCATEWVCVVRGVM